MNPLDRFFRMLSRQTDRFLNFLEQAVSLGLQELEDRLVPEWHLYWGMLRSAVRQTIFGTIMIVFIAALAGKIGEWPKVIVLTIGGVYLAWVLSNLFFYGGVLVEMLYILLRTKSRELGELRDATRDGAKLYLTWFGLLVGSEAGIIVAAWYWPIENHVTSLIPLLIVGIGLAALSFYFKGAQWWPRLVWGGLAVAAVFILAAMALPELPGLLGKAAQKANDAMACTSRGVNCPAPPTSSAPLALRRPHLVYRLERGEGRFTMAVADNGTYHTFRANKEFLIVAGKNSPAEKPWTRPEGESSWRGGAPRGEIYIEAIHPGTEVEIEEVK